MANAISNTASDPALVILANQAIIAAKPALTRASLFTLDLSDETTAPGTTLKLPIYDSGAADAWDDTNKNYGTGTGSVAFAPVTFSQYVKSYNFTDAQLAQVPAGIFQRAGEACGVGCAQKVIGAMDTALAGGTYTTASAIELASTTTADNITKKQVGEIVSELTQDPAHCVLVFSKAYYYAIMSLFDAAVWGDGEAVRNGVLSGAPFGVKAITWGASLPAGVIGLAVPDTGLVGAVRKVPCGSANAYDEVVDQTDADTGFTFQVRKYADPATGTNHVAGTVLVGAAVAQAAKIQKIIVGS